MKKICRHVWTTENASCLDSMMVKFRGALFFCARERHLSKSSLFYRINYTNS